MLLTVGAALFVLGVLIFIHELGHFLAAKAVGMGVHRFSLGLGNPTPLRFTWGETEYAISWIPFGGYVKVASREEDAQDPAGLEGGARREFPPEKYFESKPLWARLTFVLAGVTMNVVFTLVAYTSLARYGVSEDPTTRLAVVDTTALPAAAQPLRAVPFGTEVLKVNGDTVRTWDDLTDAVLSPSGDRLRFDFAPPVDPVVLAIPAGHAEERLGVAQSLVPLWEPRIGAVEPGRPAAHAGIERGDLVVAVNGDSVRYWQQLVRIIEQHAGDTLVWQVRRADSLLTVAVVPEAQEERDPVSGAHRTVGRVGAAVAITPRRVSFTMGRAVTEGVRRTGRDIAGIWVTLKGMVVGDVSPKELGGPILIGQLSGETARLGLPTFVAFMALISVNLAVLNVLPIPVLDGGHLLFLLIEGVRRKPLSLDLRMRLSQVGMVVLLAIVALVVVNDLVRVFH